MSKRGTVFPSFGERNAEERETRCGFYDEQRAVRNQKNAPEAP